MPANLEIKTKISSIEDAISKAKSIGATSKGKLHQIDIYFHSDFGRLKLRVINSIEAELIFYERNETKNYRRSQFFRYPAADSNQLKVILEKAYRVKVIVEKQRILWLYKNIRIHIDNVKNLGLFLEFEIPIATSIQNAQEAMNSLTDHFHIKSTDYILCSYSDLIKNQSEFISKTDI